MIKVSTNKRKKSDQDDNNTTIERNIDNDIDNTTSTTTTSTTTTNKKKGKQQQQQQENNKITLESLKNQFKEIYDILIKNDDEDDKIKFISYACNLMNVSINELEDSNPLQDESKQDSILATIIQDLKDTLPNVNSEAPQESIYIPKNPSFKGYTKDNTVNVDGFLYTDEDIDDLVDQGKLSNNYCIDCNSKNIAPINFVSHSTTVKQIKYIFSQNVLSNLSDKVVLDIGSRLGSVLYTGYLFSNAKELIGIEFNQYFYELQKSFIERYKMKDRVKLVHGDIMDHKELIEKSDCIYMNNVCEFFQSDQSKHIEFWKFIQSVTRKGQLLVTIPSIEESFKNNKIPIQLKKWLKKVNIDIPVQEDHPDYPDYQEIHLYKVI
eukprot:gene7841-9655_t